MPSCRSCSARSKQQRRATTGWRKIAHWRGALPDDRPGPAPANAGFVDAYDFVDKLSDAAPADELIYVDTGGNLTWTCNGFRIKRGQRLISDWNNTAMGYALPAAIGAAVQAEGGVTLHHRRRRVDAVARRDWRCWRGIGCRCGCSCSTTTATASRSRRWRPGSTRTTSASMRRADCRFVDFVKVAEAMDLPVVSISRSERYRGAAREVYARKGPVFCNVEINPAQKLYPVLKFGAPLESQLPSIDDTLIAHEMIVAPYQAAPPSQSGGAGV